MLAKFNQHVFIFCEPELLLLENEMLISEVLLFKVNSVKRHSDEIIWVVLGATGAGLDEALVIENHFEGELEGSQDRALLQPGQQLLHLPALVLAVVLHHTANPPDPLSLQCQIFLINQNSFAFLIFIIL